VIPLTRAITERIRDGLRRCAIQIDVYFTLLYIGLRIRTHRTRSSVSIFDLYFSSFYDKFQL